MITCTQCNKDLSNLDIEYHYSRNHESKPPYNQILLALREAYKEIEFLKKAIVFSKRKE
jgi:hypothetical protein